MSDNMQPTDGVLDDEVLDEAEGADSFDEVEEFDPFEGMSDEELDALCDEDESLAGFGDVEPGFRSGFVALVGRPNAGKSSLTNRLTSDDRSIVSNVAGTTRDAIDTVIEHDGQRYTIVDTAGLRQKSKIDEDVEDYGFVRAMRAIDRADVAILVIDGSIGLTDQDQRVAGFAADRQCAMVIVLNKWDLVEKDGKTMDRMREDIRRDLSYMPYAPIVFISAMTGQRVSR